jgi:uncharacterized protein YebE (UPF0316 family)
MNEIIDPWVLTWIIVPTLIFVARIMDVSIGTLRLIFIAKGYRFIAPLLGFFEVLIWLIAIRQILHHLDNWACYFAYGLGFATGNYVGMLIDQKLSLGKVVLRVILKEGAEKITMELREGGFGVTQVSGDGKSGPIKILFSTINKKDLKQAVDIIHKHHPSAFYTVEDVATAAEGYFRKPLRRPIIPMISPFAAARKGK